MRYCIKSEGGKDRYFLDIDTASALCGVSRRTFFEYLKAVDLKPEEKRRIGLKLYFDESVVSRAWILNRRHEKYTAYPVKRGSMSGERKKQLGIETGDNVIVKRESGLVSIGRKYLTDKEKEGLENG